jgi:hypothetical protein
MKLKTFTLFTLLAVLLATMGCSQRGGCLD